MPELTRLKRWLWDVCEGVSVFSEGEGAWDSDARKGYANTYVADEMVCAWPVRCQCTLRDDWRLGIRIVNANIRVRTLWRR